MGGGLRGTVWLTLSKLSFVRDGRSLEGPLATGFPPPSSLLSNCCWVNICPTRICGWRAGVSLGSCPSPQFLGLPSAQLSIPPGPPDLDSRCDLPHTSKLSSPSLTVDFFPNLLPLPTLISPPSPLTLCAQISLVHPPLLVH